MVSKTLLALGIISAGVAAFTIVDQQNLLGNNPTKQWWWQRILPAQTVKATIPAVFSIPQSQRLTQAYPSGIIAPSSITSVSTSGQINGKYR